MVAEGVGEEGIKPWPRRRWGWSERPHADSVRRTGLGDAAHSSVRPRGTYPYRRASWPQVRRPFVRESQKAHRRWRRHSYWCA